MADGKVVINISVDKHTRAWIKTLSAKTGYTMGAVLDILRDNVTEQAFLELVKKEN